MSGFPSFLGPPRRERSSMGGKELQSSIGQGDPLFPMLFILAIDPLQHILDLTTRNGILSPLPLTTAKLRTYLYADAAIVFINPSREVLLVIKDILHAFGCAWGLVTNLEKSSIHPIRSVPRDPGTFPCRYLGLQLHTHKIHAQPLIEKIGNRLTGWKGSLLNRAGRLTLVSSVLSAMPTYHLSVFPLAAWARKCIDKIHRSFLWKGKAESNGGHRLVAWPLVSMPKALGGLGVLNLDKFSRALRLRWLWKDWTLLFSAFTTFTIGDGKTAKFWHDNWLDGMAPRNLAPHLFELVPRKNKSVACEINGGNWIRSLRSKITSTVQIEEFVSLWITLQDFQLQPKVLDSITWKWNPNGVFTCPFARALWDQILAWEGLTFPTQADPARSSSIKDWWEATSSSVPKSQKRDFNGIMIYTLWNIWKERN
ncbi:LOW QUALITY PROTEIN: hypothetical protein U9M48_036039 [Paspalum notatum var. saurae]|uniref:Reverse transcriptase domain-containing protein n=1 Tax=Paspalum notatum var. saurae TaxID=547442 RepID=A0AAQ3X931_PASNO